MKTLKTLILSATMSALLMACDPNYVTTYLLKNSTMDTIKVEFYRSGSVNEYLTIPSNSTIILMHSEGIAGGPTMLYLGLEDSIRASKNGKSIVYYNESVLMAGMYDIENWIKIRHSKHTYSFTFEFTEESFN